MSCIQKNANGFVAITEWILCMLNKKRKQKTKSELSWHVMEIVKAAKKLVDSLNNAFRWCTGWVFNTILTNVSRHFETFRYEYTWTAFSFGVSFFTTFFQVRNKLLFFRSFVLHSSHTISNSLYTVISNKINRWKRFLSLANFKYIFFESIYLMCALHMLIGGKFTIFLFHNIK